MKTQIALILAVVAQLLSTPSAQAVTKAVAWEGKVNTSVLRKMRKEDRTPEEKAVLKALIKKGHCTSFNPFFMTAAVARCEAIKLGKILNETHTCKSMLATDMPESQSGEVDYRAVAIYARTLGYDFPYSPTNPSRAEKELREYCSLAGKLLVEAAYF